MRSQDAGLRQHPYSLDGSHLVVSRLSYSTASTPSPTDSSTVPFAALRSLLAGAIAGAIAKTAVAPFDRTKILMQVSQMYGWEAYRGSVWDSMRTITRTEGFFGFFRGNSATVARVMPYAAVQYYSFELYHRVLSEHVFPPDAPRPIKRLIAGSMAGCTSVLCTYPIDLARTVMAVQVSAGTRSSKETVPRPRSLGVFSTLYTILREQGVRAVYRGIYPTIVGVVPYAGINFLSYGVLRRKAVERGFSGEYPILTSLICGASAGLSTFLYSLGFCCTTLDYIALHTNRGSGTATSFVRSSRAKRHISFRPCEKTTSGITQARSHDRPRKGSFGPRALWELFSFHPGIRVNENP